MVHFPLFHPIYYTIIFKPFSLLVNQKMVVLQYVLEIGFFEAYQTLGQVKMDEPA